MSDLERVRAYFSGDRFAAMTGVEIESVSDGEAVCSFIIEDVHRNANNSVMGGALFTLADLTFAAAANVDFICGTGKRTVSLSCQITYIRPATSGRVRAHAYPIHAGNSTCCYQVDISGEDGKRLAFVTCNGYRLDR